MPAKKTTTKRKTATPPTTADRVAEITTHLEQLILSGTLKPDDRLPPERDLAEQWNVSRSVVREAIGRLAGVGLVRSRQGSGTRIGAPDGSHQLLNYQWLLKQGLIRLDHLSTARLPLETTIAALAAEHRTAEQLKRLEAEQRILHSGQASLKAHVEADMRFHAILAEATGNPIFQLILAPIQELLIESRRRTLGRYGTQLAYDHHAKILAAVRKQDPAAARKAMHEHIATNSQHLTDLANQP
ncbi:MAG: FadR family transcriptional regulator [Planctomycetia bacterium]|nr:FadR family transcriptional regulator [Planctomycetia bacterium]